MQSDTTSSAAITVTMETGNELGVKTDFLVASYSSIYGSAINSAPKSIGNELEIVQDGKVKSTFHIRVSGRMAPYLIKAVQDQNQPGYGVVLKSYFHRLQEQVMAQLFSNVGDLNFPKFS
jgi:hypothetical protein